MVENETPIPMERSERAKAGAIGGAYASSSISADVDWSPFAPFFPPPLTTTSAQPLSSNAPQGTPS